MQTKFIFAYNLERDLRNYQNTIIKWQRTGHSTPQVQAQVISQLPLRLQEDLVKTTSNTAQIKVVRKYLQDLHQQHETIYEIAIQALSRAWSVRQKEIIQRLEKLFGREFDFNQVTVNFTTLGLSPYNFKERYLMVRFNQGLFPQLKTITHELFHFMLHAHYDSYLRDKIMSVEHYEVIKEALTVFINTDFLDLVMVADHGYPRETELRKKLLALDRSQYSFTQILDLLTAWSKRAV